MSPRPWDILGSAGPGSITKVHIRVCKPTTSCVDLQSQSLLPGKLCAKQGGRKGPALLDGTTNILMFSVLCDLASKQLSCPQPLAFVHGWPSLGTEEVLAVQALHRQPDLIEA